MTTIDRTVSPRRKEDDKKKHRRRSSYFGYACARSFELRDRLLNGRLSVDDLLDITGSEKMMCPVHAKLCRCHRVGTDWINDENGRLALKLFLKHLQGETLHAFKRLVADNLDRLEELKEIARDHPNLLAKVKLVATFS